MCAACFLLGLPCLSECGQYVLDLMDTYGAGMSVIIIAMCELIAIMWVYGVRNYCRDIKAMLGFSPSWYFKVTILSQELKRHLDCNASDLLDCHLPPGADHCVCCRVRDMDPAQLWSSAVPGVGTHHRSAPALCTLYVSTDH